jgi:hypothetical protein
MGIQDIRLKFLPKYQILIGINVNVIQTFETSTEKYYDGVDIEVGIGILLFSITILNKKGNS